MADSIKRSLPNLSESEVLPTETAADVANREDLIEEIKQTADKLGRDRATRGDLKILSRTLKELRYAFKVLTPFRTHRKVTVFGSARTRIDHPDYHQAVEYGRRMAEAGWMVVTGAGLGIMEAGHLGAGTAKSIGVNIMLPFEQEPNHVISRDAKLVHLKYFFTRKLLFVKESHAIALFPGGFGTQDEGFETLTLVQTGKRDLMPIVLVDPPGGTYWKNWLKFVSDELLGRALISPADMSLFKVTDQIDEAVNEVLRFYSGYNSMRYVRGKLVLRLHQDPSDAFVERLNDEFPDIVASGRVEKSAALPHESDDAHLEHLPRLAFQFNRRDYGRLRQMVDVINTELGTERANVEGQ